MPNIKASLVLHKKFPDDGGVVIEMKVWSLPKSAQYPFGVKYSLYAIKDDKVLVGYDNHYPKGPHRHYGHVELPYRFKNIEHLLSDFGLDLRRIKHETPDDQNQKP